jgi:hypothetical protein
MAMEILSCEDSQNEIALLRASQGQIAMDSGNLPFGRQEWLTKTA